MVLLNENWKVVASANRTPGAANVTYELQARINPQYHSIELNRDYVEIASDLHHEWWLYLFRNLEFFCNRMF